MCVRIYIDIIGVHLVYVCAYIGVCAYVFSHLFVYVCIKPGSWLTMLDPFVFESRNRNL